MLQAGTPGFEFLSPERKFELDALECGPYSAYLGYMEEKKFKAIINVGSFQAHTLQRRHATVRRFYGMVWSFFLGLPIFGVWNGSKVPEL